MSDYIPRDEVARMLGISVRTLRRLTKAGALKAIPVTPAGRRIVYRRADVDAYVKRQEDAA